MPPYGDVLRLPAIQKKLQGDVILDASGLQFVPHSTTCGKQMELAFGGWFLGWGEINGIERVAQKSALARQSVKGAIRVHHSEHRKFHLLKIDAPLDNFFAAMDQIHVAHYERLRREAA